MFKNIGRWLTRALSSRFPTLYYHAIQRPKLLLLFRTEKKLAAGRSLSSSPHPSILFFTTQKCASQFVRDTLTRLSDSAGLVHADYDSYVAMVKVPKQNNPFTGAVEQAFRANGYFYGAIGTYREIPEFDKYRVLLQLRDPRDLLTSLYYSTAYSHAVINKKLLRRRKEALKQDVDTFVLDGAGEYIRIFEEYTKNLLGKKNVLFVKYEDMVRDFPNWLRNVSSHLGLGEDAQALRAIQEEANFTVTSENKYLQRRQVTPGDHLRKLRPETIEHLNKLFEPILKELDY